MVVLICFTCLCIILLLSVSCIVQVKFALEQGHYSDLAPFSTAINKQTVLYALMKCMCAQV